MLNLADREPFAVGGTRRCYVHPDDDNLCVKVLRPDRTAAARLANARGWRRLKGRRGFDDQRKELKAYRQLSRRCFGDWTHVPRCHGAVDTDQGIGIVTDLHRDWHGGFPANLEELLPVAPVAPVALAAAGGPTGALGAAIDEFKAWLRRTRFLSRDLLPHNIIAVAVEQNRYRLVIVDGIGNSELLPLSSWFDACARRKIERKIRKFDGRVRMLLPGGAGGAP